MSPHRDCRRLQMAKDRPDWPHKCAAGKFSSPHRDVCRSSPPLSTAHSVFQLPSSGHFVCQLRRTFCMLSTSFRRPNRSWINRFDIIRSSAYAYHLVRVLDKKENTTKHKAILDRDRVRPRFGRSLLFARAAISEAAFGCQCGIDVRRREEAAGGVGIRGRAGSTP